MSTTETSNESQLTAAIVNPIILATKETFNLMFDCDLERTALGIKGPDFSLFHMNAVIGLTGQAVGVICISLPEATTKNIVKKVLDLDVSISDPLACDCVRELANVIAGTAKTKITRLELEIGLPSPLRGEDIKID